MVGSAIALAATYLSYGLDLYCVSEDFPQGYYGRDTVDCGMGSVKETVDNLPKMASKMAIDKKQLPKEYPYALCPRKGNFIL